MPVGKRVLKPHGSPGAVARHRRAKEPLCELCSAGEHERNAARWAAEKAERAAALAAVRRKETC
jgi:hypothetical protein